MDDDYHSDPSGDYGNPLWIWDKHGYEKLILWSIESESQQHDSKNDQ